MEIAYFPQPINVSDDVILAQFVEVHGISPEAESKLWTTYVSKVNEFGKEKLRLFKDMECEIIDFWKGIKASSDKSSDIYTMNVMLQKMMCRDKSLTDEEYYSKYLDMKIDHFKKAIELHETCFIAYFALERKKYSYGLKVRGINRLDIPESNRFDERTIQKFIKELEDSKPFYDKNIHRMRINLSSIMSNIYVQRLFELFVETFDKQKKIHDKEIEHYKEIYKQVMKSKSLHTG